MNGAARQKRYAWLKQNGYFTKERVHLSPNERLAFAKLTHEWQRPKRIGANIRVLNSLVRMHLAETMEKSGEILFRLNSRRPTKEISNEQT